MSRLRNRGVVGADRFDRMNGPPDDQGNWVWITVDLISSPSWRALPLAARKVLDRLILEHLLHGRQENGSLIVTYDDLCAWGVRRNAIAQCLDILVKLGLIDVTARGMRSYGVARAASTYGLTWLPRSDRTPASNRWKGVKSLEAAKAIVRKALQTKRDPAGKKALREVSEARRLA